MRVVILAITVVLLFPGYSFAADISDATSECLDCHSSIAPGMVAAWESSRHARTSPLEALNKKELERRVSAKSLPKGLGQNVVGCAECHTLNPSKHSDSFEHNGYQVHIVVTPEDCSTCHPVEVKQYGQNLMSHAYGNLKNNHLYMDLVKSINGVQSFDDGQIKVKDPSPATNADSCFSCHGTKVEVKGFKARETEMGEMEFPVLSGWPNGVLAE